MLRIEDIDTSRSRASWERQIYDDLAWLGLDWPTPVRRQSDHIRFYRQAIEKMWKRGLLFVCDCNRRDVLAAAAAPQEGDPRQGPDGVIYPGTCRDRHRRTGPLPDGVSLRLDMRRAVGDLPPTLRFDETGEEPGEIRIDTAGLPESVGDIVLARRDMGTSYHLSVVIDDAAQGVTCVVRGLDLFEATQIHVAIQGLMGLSSPVYHHHRLIRDEHGKRLAKRDDARAIATYRAAGVSPSGIRNIVGLG